MKKNIFIIALILISGIDLLGQSLELKTVLQTGGIDWDMVNSIYIDEDHSILTTGSFQRSFEVGQEQYTSNGVSDIIFEKLDQDNHVEWLKTFGGHDRRRNTLGEFGKKIVSNNKDIYLSGIFYGQADFVKTKITSRGKEDVFLAKFDRKFLESLKWRRVLDMDK